MSGRIVAWNDDTVNRSELQAEGISGLGVAESKLDQLFKRRRVSAGLLKRGAERFLRGGTIVPEGEEGLKRFMPHLRRRRSGNRPKRRAITFPQFFSQL